MKRVGSADAGTAIAEWFDLYARSVGDYAARRVGSDLSADIVGDTFRIAYEQHDDFDSRRGDARGWLFGIATNLIHRHWRTEERRLRNQARAMSGDTGIVDPVGRSDDRLDAIDKYERVVDAVANLEPVDRDLLILIAWEGMTSAEVAAILDIPAGTVRSRLNRIRTHLEHVARPAVSGSSGQRSSQQRGASRDRS